MKMTDITPEILPIENEKNVISVEASSTGILMSTLWNQSGIMQLGSNKSITYNEYCPIISGSTHAVTGCTNTAAGQMIYYYIEKKGLKLALTLNSDDEYTSSKNDTTIQIKADGSTPGTISFAAVNNMLSSYDLNSASDAAALVYACGVVQQADYGSSTSTAWNQDLFIRAGLKSANTSRLYWDHHYYWGSSKDDKSVISQGAWEVIIENLQAGLVVGTSIPGHAVVIDGYDSSNDTFHVNYGWGNTSSTRWYSRSEMIEQNFDEFVFDVGMKKNSYIYVDDKDFYGTGTLLRAFEKANSHTDADTILFQKTVAGERVDLLDCITIQNDLTATNMNMSVTVTDARSMGSGIGFMLQNCSAALGGNGALIVNTDTTNYAYYAKTGSKLNLSLDGGLLWSGKYAVSSSYVNGSTSILNLLKQSQLNGGNLSSTVTDNSASHYAVHATQTAKSTIFSLSSNSIAAGKVSTGAAADDIAITGASRLIGDLNLGGGDDYVTVSGGSSLIGTVNAGEGNDKLTIDSSSNFTGTFYNYIAVKLNLQAGYRSDSMITVSKLINNFYAYASTITVDISKAVNGTYTLLTGYTDPNMDTYLKNLKFNITGKGNDSTLSVYGSTFNNYASLAYNNCKLTLTIRNIAGSYGTAEAPGGFNVSIDGNSATLNWNQAENSKGYLYRVGKTSVLSGDGVLVSGNSAQLYRLDKNSTYYYQVRSVNALGELSAWSSVQSFVAGQSVDLQVTRFASAAVITPNAELTISYTVKNLGTSAAKASKLYIYVDGAKVGETSVSAIAAGASYDGIYIISAGVIRDGSHKVRLLADGENIIKESSENNNGYSRTIEAVAPADLVVSRFKSSASNPVNQDLKLDFTVTNNGDGAAAASKVYIYVDGVKIGEAAVSAIAAGGTADGSYTISKNTLTQGSHRIRLVADGANTVAESDNNNNGYSKLVDVTAPAATDVDLLITSFSAPASANHNTQIKLSFTVRNNGKGTAAPGKLYVYNDGVKIGEAFVGTISGGGTYNGSFLIPAGTLTAGEHRLRLLADGANAIEETNEDNNGYSRAINITAPADLVVASFSCASSISSKQSLTLTYTVKNNGPGTAEASLLYIYSDGVKIGQASVGALAAGASYKGTYTIAANTLTAGEHRLRLLADGANWIEETDNNNNGYSRAVTLTNAGIGKVDLQVTTFAGASEFTDSEAFKINFTVKNAGTDIAQPCKLYIYDDGVKIGEVFVGTIYGNSTYSGSYTIAAGKLAAGANRIRLVADGENIIAETNEDNNGYTRTITVKSLPDLVISKFTAPDAASAGQSVKLSFTVRNNGKGAAAASKLYIYSDGIKIGESSVSALAAGASYQGSFTLAAGSLTKGTHKLRVLTDGANVVPELDNNNNGYSRNINIIGTASALDAWDAPEVSNADAQVAAMPELSVEPVCAAASLADALDSEISYFANSAAAPESTFADTLTGADQDKTDKLDMLLA